MRGTSRRLTIGLASVSTSTICCRSAAQRRDASGGPSRGAVTIGQRIGHDGLG